MARTETRPLALVTSEPVRVDLSRGEGVDELHQVVVQVGRPLDAAALNAGIGSGGEFDETPLEQEPPLVDLNVRSTVQLAKYVARDGFEALMAGKERVVSASLKTKVQGRAGRLVPDSMKARMHGERARPGSGDD